MPAPRPVTVARATDAQREAWERGGAPIGGALPRSTRYDAVLDAWIEMLLPYFSGDECCFFTGTYRDAVGYQGGFMLPRNVLKDFERFLKSQGLDSKAWVVCAETHKERDILHVHALVAGCGLEERMRIQQAWRVTRGGSEAAKLHDGGVSYCGKYALKGQDACMFEWNLSPSLLADALSGSDNAPVGEERSDDSRGCVVVAGVSSAVASPATLESASAAGC